MNEVVHVYRIGYPLSVIGISPKFYIGASLAPSLGTFGGAFETSI